MNSTTSKSTDGIAIVGMAGKFPGVENIQEYWNAITEGKELLKRFSKEELLQNGLNEDTINHKHFVPVNGLIHTAEMFDSNFFGFTPREADLTDPQHRKFLEVCYEALEHAGQAPDNPSGPVGVFAGCSMNNYLIKNLLQFPELLRNNGEFQTIVNNDKDFLTTKVSYKLNLTGPSFDIQTACSTSLVAIHVACQNLLNFQCDVALGGGAFIGNPRGHGYMFKPGGIESDDGICRPFDTEANGTIFGEGVGVVVLKRLEDAIKDKDEIWAVIKSSAINNDGSFKIGYMAPSTDGQAEAISMALQFGDIDPKTISYVEAHGTGTNLGDPIEISGLTNVYREYTDEKAYCAIGSVKGNIGHCDVAAGVAGLIKTAMALKFKKLPPSINFNTPNPELELENSPFYVNTQLQDWNTNGEPRRAAISSFGIGGTNAHCVLEEWEAEVSEPSELEYHLLPISAKSDAALADMKKNLINHLEGSLSDIGDIAHTLQTGRNHFTSRTILAGKSKEDIVQKYTESDQIGLAGKRTMENPSTVFMFTGQGNQYLSMAKGLYENFELFRNVVDEADEILKDKLDFNLKEILFHDFEDKEYQKVINLTANSQPLLFVVQYATACLLTEFGIYPDALIGHSIGELTAATFSGVFSFDDALLAVANRGRLMQEQQPGTMLSVNLPAEKLQEHLNERVELALQNAPNYSVVSGNDQDILDFENYLKNNVQGVHTTVLKTSHAFHSKSMEPALEPFTEILKTLELNPPEIPFISNVSGTWITPEQACDPAYWASHIRSTVLFSRGVSEIFQSEKEAAFIEIGPGNSLSMLLSQFDVSNAFKAIPTIRHPRQQENDTDVFFKAVSDFWACGGNISWSDIYDGESRYKVPLPTYPFERKRHWIDPKVHINIYTGTESKAISPVQNSTTEEETTTVSALHSRPNLGVAYKEPETKEEIAITDIWKELLGIEQVGVNDDFFELGGHSLLASQVIVRINEQFNVKLPLDSIFNSPTVASLCTKNQLQYTENTAEKEEIVVSEDGDFPLSQEQQRLWIINKIDSNNPAYNIPFTYRLKGNINVEVLNKSFTTLIERHKVLKSIIWSEGTTPVCSLSDKTYNINYIDISFEAEDGKPERIQEILSKETRTNFDLENGPLIRLTLIKSGNNNFVFHLTVQHLVFDGWSWGIFSKEISTIYNDLVAGKEVSLPIQDIQYFDFSRWQEKQTESDDEKKSMAFWKEQLKDIPVETKFPYDHKRPTKISGIGGRENILIDSELTNKLKAVGKEEQSTLFMTMLTAFGAMLNLYTNENDICIGTPTGNRTKSRFEKIIGFFVNTIVFRLNIDKKKSFKEILNDNRQSFLDSLEHQDVPFDKVVEALQPERVLNINPLFQIMFAWQNAPRPPLSFGGIEQERVVVKDGISPLDITFYMWENNGQIEGEIEYNADILERETIIHLKNNFIQLIGELVASIDAPIKSLNGISEYAGDQLASFNNTKVDLENILLHEQFEKSVERFPNKIALVSEGAKLTYAQLDEKANKLANYLLQYNVNESFIGLSLPRTEQLVIAALAILKAGANYLPLDPDFPDDRLKYIVSDAGAKLLITNTELKGKYEGIETDTILIDKTLSEIEQQSSTRPDVKNNTESLAYTIYTSGSTGNPKGVKVPHRAAVNFIESMAKVPGMSESDVLMAVTTLSFDISVLELFLPLHVGGTIVLASKRQSSSGKAMLDLIAEQNVTILQATPATWNILLMSKWEGNSNLKALCGGEAIQPTLIKQLLPKVSELWNMYGPTETTVWSTCYQITEPDAPVLVGTPIDNTDILILNEENKELPQGVFGEVCIGGLGVTAGYHNREALTKEKFISFNGGETVYKTGDWGRILTSGQIELAGRIDNQIKLRGFRIEPGEIETVIGKEPGIGEVVVKVQKFDEIDERLIAFVTKDNSASINVDAIKAKIGAHLPNYMVPSNFSIRESFPKTPNGKIDKKALIYSENDEEEIKPTQEAAVEEVKSNSVVSGNVEDIISEIWKKHLKKKNIGSNENFFDIGGNSLMLIAVSEAINAKFNEDIDIVFYFEYATIASFSKYVAETFNIKTEGANGSAEKESTSRKKLQLIGQRRRR